MSVIENAERLLALGYSVIPVQHGKKTPSIQWGEFADRRPTRDELQRWFANQPSNLAVVTGPISGLLVVDIDRPELYQNFISTYPTGMVSRTPRGGYHLFYSYAGSDIGNSVSRLASGIDVRCRRGYVVVAPSVIDGVGRYAWVTFDRPSPLPDALRELIIRQVQENGQYELASAREDAADMWLRIIARGFTPDRHNEEAKDVARYLYRRGMPENEIIATLLELNAKDPTPQPKNALIATIRSGLGYEARRKEKAVTETETEAVDFDATPLLNVLAQYDDYYQKWLIEDWLPEDSLMMVAAPPEQYKTWLLLDAAISVSLGREAAPFLGRFPIVNDPLPVYVIQQEDSMGQLATRFRAIQKAKGASITYPLHVENYGRGKRINFGLSWFAPIFVHTNAALSLDNEASLDALETMIDTHGIRLVVIDPFYMLGNAEDFFASDARRMKRFKAMRDKYNTAFLIAHHTRKSGGNGRDAIFGSQLLNGVIEGVWLIEERTKADEKVRLIHRKGKAFPGAQQTLQFDINIVADHVYQSPTVSVVVDEQSSEPSNEQIERAIGAVETYIPYEVTADVYNENQSEPEPTGGWRKYEEEVYTFIKTHPNVGIAAIQRGLDISNRNSVYRVVTNLTMRGLLLKVGAKYSVPISLPEGV